MDRTNYRVLLIDDDEAEYAILSDLFEQAEGAAIELSWEPDGRKGLEAILRQYHDLYLVDYMMAPDTGVEILRAARAQGATAPVIILTNRTDRAADDDALESGADDFLVKNQLDAALLERSVRYALERAAATAAREKLIGELREALATIRTLRGLIPLCANCRKVRDDSGYWQALDEYVAAHSDVQISHGLCPECARALYPDYAEEPPEPGPPTGEVSP